MAKKQQLDIIRCADCRNAQLKRFNPMNPLIAICKYEFIPNQVANAQRTCNYFTPK